MMTTSKNRRLIFVHRWSLGSGERAENEPVTNNCAENKPITKEYAENYQPITNEWSLENIFVENNAAVVVRPKQHGRQSNTIDVASRRSRQDRILTF